LRRWVRPAGSPPGKARLSTGKLEYLSKTDLFRDLSHGELKELERMTALGYSLFQCRPRQGALVSMLLRVNREGALVAGRWHACPRAV